MSLTLICMFVGLLLGIAEAAGGFSGFLITLVLGIVGFVVGKVLTGDVDLSDYVGGRGRQQ